MSSVLNLHRFAAYTLLTSTDRFDTGRAITNATAILLLGPAVLTTPRPRRPEVRIDARA